MTPRFFLRRFLILLPILSLAVACSTPSAPTPFRPPTAVLPTQIPPTSTPIPFTPTAAFTFTPTLEAGPCTNQLTFLDDLTIEDGTAFTPGAAIDKQWLVQNDGTCDWDATYKLKWVGGYTLGVTEEQPLFPARAGVQVTLRIVFTAPAEPGTYQTTWQAADPNGNLFGDTVYMEIIVQ
ncbi:MAG: NBR1-Ig-like domain-containing protein [Anaerolineales bacterium]